MAKSSGEVNPFVAVLRISNFRNLWLSQVLSQVFLNVLVFSLMIRIYELTGSNIAVAGMLLTATVPNFLFGAIAGVLIDRWDRKMVMFLAHFFRVLVVLAFLLSSESLVWLYVLSFLISLITQFFQPAEAAMIGVVVSDNKKLLTANSLFSLTFFSSVVIGNVLAGPSLKLFGADGMFLIVAVAFGAASYFTAKVPGQSVREWFSKVVINRELSSPIDDLKKSSFIEDLLTGLDYLKKNRTVRSAAFLMVLGQIVIATLGTIAPGFAHKILRLDPSDVSLYVMAPAALGMIGGAILVGQRFNRSSKESMIRGGLLTVALILLLFSFTDQAARMFHVPVVPVSIVILLLLGISNAFLDIPVNTIVQEETPVEIRSRIYGFISTVTGGISIPTILLAGTIGDLLGVRVVMIFLGVAVLVAGGYYYASNNR